MKSILTKVSEEVDRKKTADSDTKKSAKRRGQAPRKAYTNELKYKIICQANMMLPKSMVSINLCSLVEKRCEEHRRCCRPKT